MPPAKMCASGWNTAMDTVDFGRTVLCGQVSLVKTGPILPITPLLTMGAVL